MIITVAAYAQDDVLVVASLSACSVMISRSLSLYISSILAPARSFKTHGRKIRVISKNLLPTPTHDERTCHQPHLYCKLHTNQTQQLTHAHYPHHDVLALLPLDQPPMSTTLLLASLSRVERHGCRLQYSTVNRLQVQTHKKHAMLHCHCHEYAAIIRRYYYSTGNNVSYINCNSNSDHYEKLASIYISCLYPHHTSQSVNFMCWRMDDGDAIRFR